MIESGGRAVAAAAAAAAVAVAVAVAVEAVVTEAAVAVAAGAAAAAAASVAAAAAAEVTVAAGRQHRALLHWPPRAKVAVEAGPHWSRWRGLRPPRKGDSADQAKPVIKRAL